MIQCHRTNEFIFTDNSQSSETYTRYWDFDNGSFGSNQIETQSFVYGTKNYFDVKLRIETSGGCKDSLSKRVFLIGHPDTNSISGLTDVKLFDTATYSVPATTGSIYLWRFSNGIGYSLGNAITLKWTKVGLDTLYLVEQSSGGCLSDTMRLPISIRSGVGLDNLQQMGFNVYPNPANQQVYIESKNLPSYSWSLTNALGELVLVQTEEKGTRILDINNLTNGIYFLQITNDLGQINVSKLVVQH
ncbi:MAG: T9SS type A sorting domain-containing protein [Bacteroidia bacterium]|nr:T9SS type A sorting domain-containing protein [Bacteroidia bacterium]